MPSVLITGVGRLAGIGAACARTLAGGGWDVGLTCWRPYDRDSDLQSADTEPDDLVAELRAMGIRAELVHADLADPGGAATVFTTLEPHLGPISAVVAAHCRDMALPL